jgi:hypothetical protein
MMMPDCWPLLVLVAVFCLFNLLFVGVILYRLYRIERELARLSRVRREGEDEPPPPPPPPQSAIRTMHEDK